MLLYSSYTFICFLFLVHLKHSFLFRTHKQTDMVLDKLKNTFDDAVERTKDAVNSVEDATEGKEEQQLENEHKQEMNTLVREYKEALVKSLFASLDNQNWQEAEKIAREEGVSNDAFNELVYKYIEIRDTRGKQNLKVIEYQLIKCEKFLSMAKDANSIPGFKQNLKKAVKYYKEIEKDEILEVQRDISRAENAIKHYGGQKGGKIVQKTKRIHQDINRLDKDVKKAEQDLETLLNQLKS